MNAFTYCPDEMQRHAARDSSVHDPLLGHGDPYGYAQQEEEQAPASSRLVPTPVASIAGTATQLLLTVYRSKTAADSFVVHRPYCVLTQ